MSFSAFDDTHLKVDASLPRPEPVLCPKSVSLEGQR